VLNLGQHLLRRSTVAPFRHERCLIRGAIPRQIGYSRSMPMLLLLAELRLRLSVSTFDLRGSISVYAAVRAHPCHLPAWTNQMRRWSVIPDRRPIRQWPRTTIEPGPGVYRSTLLHDGRGHLDCLGEWVEFAADWATDIAPAVLRP
jgi:hypothetical protein